MYSSLYKLYTNNNTYTEVGFLAKISVDRLETRSDPQCVTLVVDFYCYFWRNCFMEEELELALKG